MSDPAWTPPPVPEPVQPAPPASSARRLRIPSRRVWATATVVLVGVLVASFVFFFLFLTPSNDTGGPLRNAVRFNLPRPNETDSIDGAQFAVSPDGTQIVLATRGPDAQQHLWVRALQSLEWRELTGTEGAAFPFWSPDSRHVGFFAGRSLKRIDISSGLTHTLCDAPAGRGGTWSSQDVIVFAANNAGPLSRVRGAGGTPQPATVLDESRREVAHLWPHFLPDGQTFVYVVATAGGMGRSTSAGTYAGSLDSAAHERRLIVPGGRTAAFAQGFLLFLRGTALVAQPFHPNSGELTDDIQPIGGAEQIAGAVTRGSAFSVSSHVLVYQSGGPALSQLTWFDRAGRGIRTSGDPGDYRHFSLSPDGRSVAAARDDARNGTSSIWLVEAARDGASRLTVNPSQNSSPVWSPDGTRIVFVSGRDSAGDLYVTAASGGGKEEILLQSPQSKRPTDWSRDGRFLLYSTESAKTGSDLWIIPLFGDRKPQPFSQTQFNESQGRFSPDARWVAYVSDESGRNEVYVRPFPQPDGKWQISTEGGIHPRWRGDGRELFFVSADRQLKAVEVEAGSAFRTGVLRVLFPMWGLGGYDTADGQRFLVKMPVRERDPNGLHVILNWSAELRR